MRVHDEFRPALNRELSPTSASDSESYTEENLFEAEFLLIENLTKLPNEINEFGRYDIFSNANWTLRNGDEFTDIGHWQIDVEWLQQVSPNLGYSISKWYGAM